MCSRLLKTESQNYGIRAFFFIVNVIYTPILLVVNSFSIFVFPCVSFLIGRFCCGLLFSFQCLASCLIYTDSSFPANDSSIGNIESNKDNIKWIRLQNLTPNSQSTPCLFNNATVDAIRQGTLGKHLLLYSEKNGMPTISSGFSHYSGDCWILASFAALCERPGWIQRCFVTESYNPRGKYTVRLYDKTKKAFVKVTVDDFIPCRDGRPIFAQFVSNEMWPLILEKAFAKFKGSYAAIEGGDPIHALEMLTGYESAYFSAPYSAEIFPRLQKFFDQGCLLCTGSRGASADQSIVPGHAYSIMNMKTPSLTTASVKLLKLRNPWGSFEWNGNWSDNSDTWKKFPGVAFEIGKPEQKDDGMFFMAWEDFEHRFDWVGVIFPGVGIENLHITINESNKVCGALCGCLGGCGRFWCCCRGFYSLWFVESSHDKKFRLNDAKKVTPV